MRSSAGPHTAGVRWPECMPEAPFRAVTIFTYKSSTFLDDPETGFWVVEYTERVVRVCAALLLGVHRECLLWYVLIDVIEFAGELGFTMEMPLGSRVNVPEVLELLDVIEATNYILLSEQWSDLQLRAIDYHSGRTGRGGDFVYYDRWWSHKIDDSSTPMCADATRILSDDLECCWVHLEEDVEKTPRDDTRDYHRSYGQPHSQINGWANCGASRSHHSG